MDTLTETVAAVAEETEELAAGNSSFSRKLPGLQVAWDSTSLGALKTCPRYYYYILVRGYTPRAMSVHLRFGIEFHAALELYDRERAEGAEHETAVLRAVRATFIRTWDSRLKRPWASDDTTKNRETLIRAIVWYLEQFEDDPLETVIRADGRPAVEQSFRFEAGIQSESTGEEFLICGHLDRVARLNGRTWIVDRKTTRGAIGDAYFAKYSPDNQMSLYDVGGQVIAREPIAGIIIDAGQTGVNYTRFQRGFVPRTPSQRDEWLHDLSAWLRMAEAFARAQHWPQNDKSCDAHSSYSGENDAWRGGCPFRPVCGSAPEVRQPMLDGMYDKRIWDPLQTREV